MNIESVTAAEKVLKRKLPKCDIAAEKLNNPKIKIVGIDNYTKMDIQEIETDIIQETLVTQTAEVQFYTCTQMKKQNLALL